MHIRLTKNRQYIFIALLLLLLIVAIGFATAYFSKRKQQKREQQAVNDLQARLDALLLQAVNQEASQSYYTGNPYGVSEKAAQHYQDDAHRQVEQVEQVEQREQAVFPLKIGSKGKEVEQLQMYLMRNAGGFTKAQLSGVFDEHTQQRLQGYLHRDTISEQNFRKRKIFTETTYNYV